MRLELSRRDGRMTQHPLSWPSILIQRDSGQTGCRIAPHGTDTKQRIRESFIQSESPQSIAWWQDSVTQSEQRALSACRGAT